ncbi:universal stress protein [Desulfuromonas carbonis]|uniref:universal stress protein n=1 Tax=Desulfuromonas sp. DDH964 TaxID=1823759 RepID=UPI00078C07E3|nr:universal stress protein [Desulfuromonas sp. DDH964]AMV71166.1 universal stress protein Usp [Desulfuromonas sp. DDH964]
MIQHLLVPLDGSTLAEAALPVAQALALALDARITLMHVIEEDAAELIHGEPHLTEATAAAAYLQRLQQRLQVAGLRIDCHVHATAVVDVAAGIAAHQQELRPDLIVMCTHGPAGLARRMRGSLAQQVVELGQTPLLLVRPDSSGREDIFSLQQILVPLDGRAEHGAGLDLAMELAAAAGACLQLLSIVATLPSLAGTEATLSRFLPASSQKLQELAQQGLRQFLDAALARAAAEGITASAELRAGKVPVVIAEAASAGAADLIVMATHGKAGAKAFWANSVAGAVQAKTSRPLLLVPV